MLLNGLNKYQGFGRLTHIEGFLKMKILSGNLHKHCIPDQEQLQNIQLYRVYKKKGNRTSAPYYTSITWHMNNWFSYSERPGF